MPSATPPHSSPKRVPPSRTGGSDIWVSARPRGGGAWEPRCSPPVLVRCDTDGVPAAAAVFSWANVRFLRGFGFEVGWTGHTADDELPLWVLVRQPLRR